MLNTAYQLPFVHLHLLMFDHAKITIIKLDILESIGSLG